MGTYIATRDKAMNPAFCKLGLFSDLGYLWSGRPIIGLNLPSSCKGNQMLPGYGHSKAATNDAYFSDYIPAYAYEKYFDQMTLLRRYNLKKKIGMKGGPFYSMFGPKSMNGRAMLWGTFIDEYEAFSPLKKTVKPEKVMRGIYTSPGKLGTGYGYSDVCFDKYPTHSINATKKERRMKLSENLKGRSPFYDRAHTEGYFGPNPYLQHTKGPEYRMRFPKVWVPEKTFFPPRYPQHPGNNHAGCFDLFPTWYPDPYKKRVKTTPIGNKTFMPFPGPKSTRTNSILRQYITKQVNGKNCNLIVPVVYAPTLNKK